jgi:hypothetical protein
MIFALMESDQQTLSIIYRESSPLAIPERVLQEISPPP